MERSDQCTGRSENDQDPVETPLSADSDSAVADSVVDSDNSVLSADSVRVLTSVDSTNTYAVRLVRQALAERADADCADVVRGLFDDGCDESSAVESSVVASDSEQHVPMSVVLSDTQTAGRGRLDRTWYNEPGESFVGTFVTAVPKALLDGGSSGWMTMAAGLAAIDALEKTTGLIAVDRQNETGYDGCSEGVTQDVRDDDNQIAQDGDHDDRAQHDQDDPRLALKWPNDVYLAGRKLGGILAELAAVRGDTAIVVFGIGLNLFVPADRLPTDQSTSLQLQVAALPEHHAGHRTLPEYSEYAELRNRIADGIASSLRHRLTLLAADPVAAAETLRKETVALSWTLGRHVTARLAQNGAANGRVVEGVAESINADASLTIRTADGGNVTVTTGDVGVE